VTRKFCHTPEVRVRFKDGSNRRLFFNAPVFELREEAEEYLRLLKEKDSLKDKIATLDKSMTLLKATPVCVSSFRSNAPDMSNHRHYHAWKEAGAIEILTEEKA
jgi:hypothetical protein